MKRLRILPKNLHTINVPQVFYPSNLGTLYFQKKKAEQNYPRLFPSLSEYRFYFLSPHISRRT